MQNHLADSLHRRVLGQHDNIAIIVNTSQLYSLLWDEPKEPTTVQNRQVAQTHTMAIQLESEST